MNNFLIDYTHTWYDGINTVHEICMEVNDTTGLKAEYFYMYLEGVVDSDYEYHF